MAPRRPGSATSTSDNSHSPPSDAPSPHFSPISNSSSTGLHPPSEDDSPGSRSARSTPSRQHFELSRSYSAGKGGCWTCRLRRKKCDEQRVGDSCKTCIRLNIDCLGWGIKRPEWMRDKQQVQAYRAKITDKLRRENRIRGQPRQAYIQAQSLPTTPTVQPSSNGRTRPRSFVGGPTLSMPLDWSTQESSSVSSHHNQQTFLSSQPTSRPESATNSPHIPGIPSLGSYPDQTLNALDISASLPFPLIPPTSNSPMPIDSLSNIPFTMYPVDLDSSALHLQTQPQQSLLLQQQSDHPVRQQQQQHESMSGQTSELVLYFFENVKSLQFKLFGDTSDVTNVIYSIIVQEPRGAVASAVCAIASLHHTRMQQAAGYEPPDSNPDHSFNKFLYDQAFFQLINSKHLHGGYSESDAIAALTLTSFALLSDGWIDWSTTLQIAQDWFAECGILADENPRLFITNMGSGGSFAAKTTIWLDIMSSITTMQPPRFMDLYHRLFNDKTSYSAHLRMEQVTGFSDDVLYAIAQISTLANWKTRESINGRLSVRDLIRRGDAIERTLRRSEQEEKSREIGFDGEALQSLSSDHSASGGASQFANEDIRRIVRDIFHETAVLYLHTVLSDPNPGVQEITTGVDSVIQLLQQLPPSELDQTLVFPTCLAGCMTDNQGQRQYLISRIQGSNNMVNLLQARVSMEGVWHRRDLLRQAGAPSWEIIDWRESLRDHGVNLLLV